MRAKKYI